MQFQRKSIIQTQEKGKKPHFGPDLDLLCSNSRHFFFLSKIWPRKVLDAMVSYHHLQYQEKLMIQF